MSETLLNALSSTPAHLPALTDATRRLSYGELRQLVSEEREWLTTAEVVRCGLLAENGTAWVITDLALLACRAVHVPLPGYFTCEQRCHVIDDAGIDTVLTDEPDRVIGEHPQFSLVGVSRQTGLSLLRRPRCREVRTLSPDVTKVTYTSGSTGTPKGVCLSAQSIASVAQSLAAATAELEIMRHMCLLPLATLLENIAGVYVPLLLGAESVVRPVKSLGVSYGGVNASHLLAAIREVAPESLVLVPELLRLLIHASGRGWVAPRDLKFIAVGGASVSAQLLARAHECGLPAFEGYGLSECASVVCLNTRGANRPGSVGRPLLHARVRIDVNGEICVSGVAMSGYLGEGGRSSCEIRTGDLGEIDADGFVYVRGRAKNMFITSMGRNIAPEWVERELTCEPAIAQAMVIGEARPFPIALIAAVENASDAIVEHAVAKANARLPDYARIRRWIAFPEAPSDRNGLLTANGRLRRDIILQRHDDLIQPIYYDLQEKMLHAVS
jgi:long-subunit acyl-CoA synthetase (AMP-forming)